MNDVSVSVCDLGTWGPAFLIAEYDPHEGAIRVNVRAVERVRAALGDVAAERFVACAVAHERYHHDHPGCGEADAHAYAQAQCGTDPAAFEAVLR